MSTSVGVAGSVARYLDGAVPPQEHPRAFVALERQRLGPVLTPDQHRVAAHAAVGRDREASAVVVGAGHAPVRLGADERLIGQPDDDPVDLGVGLERAQRGVQARRDPALRVRRCARPIAGAGTAACDPVVGDHHDHRRQPAADARRATACATSGRPPSASSGLGVSPPNRSPRPAASTTAAR